MLPPKPMLARWVPYLLALVLTGFSGAASAKDSARTHVVASGQRLGSIAKRYGVSIAEVCEANGISRRDPIRPGQRLVIPVPGQRARPTSSTATQPEAAQNSGMTLHRVERGHLLGSIANRYGVSIDAICRENRIQRSSILRPGQVLRIPNPKPGTAPAPAPAAAAAKPAASNTRSAYARAPRKKGYVEFQNQAHKFRGHVFDKKGRILPAARNQIAGILGIARGGPALDDRLIRALVEVSDHFGGRPLRIVSGYRKNSYFKDSKHKQSRAVDFSIPGVPNEVVRDYVRTFSRAGVGYYPNSSFIHLDVREYSAYWVDYSRPGEAPRRSPNRLARADSDLHDEEPNGPSKKLEAPALDVAGAIPAPPETLTKGAAAVTGTVPAGVLRPPPARALGLTEPRGL